jgi:hypothetical protein
MKYLIRFNKLILFFTSLIVISCGDEKPSSDNFGNLYPDGLINSTEYDFKVEFQNYIDEFETDPLNSYRTIGSLDTDRSYIFGDIRKVLLIEGLIFLLDARSKQLKIFNLESGRHIETFDLEGRGPGELLFPEDMIFDESNRTLIILDRQRKLLKYKLDRYTPEIADEAILDYLPENFCLSKNAIVIRNRMTAADWHDETPGNIAVYEKDGYALQYIIGDFFESDNWLLTNQLSRGTIYCSDKDDNLYSVDRYLPQLTVFKGPGFIEMEKVLFQGLDLIKIVPEYRDGQPGISYYRGNGAAIVHNVITSENNVFVQLYELHPTGEETIRSYQIDKNNYTLKRYFGDLGTIHQITDSLLITSVNTPYPRVEIYMHKGL